MKLTKDYILDFKSRFTYNTNKIEGSTISLAETVSILKNSYLPGGKSLRELYEVVNHSQAIDFILEYDDKIDIFFIKEIHGILMDRLNHDKGKFKEFDNKILGADFATTPAYKIEEEMQQYFGNLNYQLKNNSNLFEVLAETHIKYERIHPFSDGNGRTGRLLMNKILLNNNIPPVIIDGDNKGKYYDLLSNQDTKGLTKYLEELSKVEAERIKSFAKAEEQKITFKGNESSDLDLER